MTLARPEGKVCCGGHRRKKIGRVPQGQDLQEGRGRQDVQELQTRMEQAPQQAKDA